MTRLLHIADVHAGILTHSVPDPESGLPSALVSTLRCLRDAIEYAVETEVDGVIIAGDLYHSPNPPAAAIVGVERELAKLRDEDIPTIVYPGNHDRAPHTGQRSIVSVHSGGSVQADFDGAAASVRAFGDLLVGVLPSTSRNAIMRWNRGDTPKAATRREADEQIVDRLSRTLGSWAEDTSEATPDIITGHWPVAGSVLGGEIDIAITEEPMLSPADLEGPWRYAAMGHIHKAQAIRSADRTIGGYSGSVDRLNFGEEDYLPRAMKVHLGENDVSTQAFFLPARMFRTIDLSDRVVAYDPVAFAEDDVRAANAGGVIRIRGRFPDGDLYQHAMTQADEMRTTLLDSGASIVRVEVEAIRSDRVRVADISKAPTELEALDLWIETNRVEDDQAFALREFARMMLDREAVR